jgi:hypothetical protein
VKVKRTQGTTSLREAPVAIAGTRLTQRRASPPRHRLRRLLSDPRSPTPRRRQVPTTRFSRHRPGPRSRDSRFTATLRLDIRRPPTAALPLLAPQACVRAGPRPAGNSVPSADSAACEAVGRPSRIALTPELVTPSPRLHQTAVGGAGGSSSAGVRRSRTCPSLRPRSSSPSGDRGAPLVSPAVVMRGRYGDGRTLPPHRR